MKSWLTQLDSSCRRVGDSSTRDNFSPYKRALVLCPSLYAIGFKYFENKNSVRVAYTLLVNRRLHQISL